MQKCQSLSNGKPSLTLLPHTPHTIRTTVRPCESCHDSEITLGLGDPKRNVIVDSGVIFLHFEKHGYCSLRFSG